MTSESKSQNLITGTELETNVGAAMRVERVSLSEYAKMLLRSTSTGIQDISSETKNMEECEEDVIKKRAE